jgi:hypothetical protein
MVHPPSERLCVGAITRDGGNRPATRPKRLHAIFTRGAVYQKISGFEEGFAREKTIALKKRLLDEPVAVFDVFRGI